MLRLRSRWRLALASLATLMLTACWSHQPSSDLLAGLEEMSLLEADVELDRRLNKRFPNGMSEDELIEALEDAGFEVGENGHWACDAPRCAGLNRWVNPSTTLIYVVSWKADQRRRVTNVNGSAGIN